MKREKVERQKAKVESRKTKKNFTKLHEGTRRDTKKTSDRIDWIKRTD
jgi:hypothetical protein